MMKIYKKLIINNENLLSALSYFFFFLVHTSDELKLTGNCLKYSRPVLSFSAVDLFKKYKLNFVWLGFRSFSSLAIDKTAFNPDFQHTQKSS